MSATRNPVTLTLPWPSQDLSPNARLHWAKKAKAVKSARSLAAWTATSSRQFESCKGRALNVTAIFCPPDKRPRDADNMLASVKPYFDGIADVVGINDSKWAIAMRRENPRSGGEVRIEIEVMQ